MKHRFSLYILAFLSIIIIMWGLMYIFRIHLMHYHLTYLAMTEEQLIAVDSNIVPLPGGQPDLLRPQASLLACFGNPCSIP